LETLVGAAVALERKIANREIAMKMSKEFCGAIFAALLGWFALTGPVPIEMHAAQEARTAAKTSPEMDRLKNLYLGTWDYTETYDKTPFYPNGGSDTGVYTSEPGPGGNSIVNRFHSKSPMGDVDGMLVMTWDSQEKAYKSYVFGNDSPGCLIQTGNFEGDTLVYHSEIAAGGMHIKLRNVTRLVTSGGIVSEQWVAADSGPEKLLVRVEAKRRP
jgi:hypothetical protein